jgi:Concanavalin A-like lectin/glucanases superfamily
VAYQCVNASNQYFTIPALNMSVPPVTFSLWIRTTSVVAKDTALFLWRGSVNTGVLLVYASSNWELRYYVNNGLQWQTSTGLFVSTGGAWQHVCVAISSSQARLYLDGNLFTNNVSHSTANINESGNLARDSLLDAFHTSFNGSVAAAAIWTATLSNDECLALAKRLSPLGLKNRLHDLALYKDLIRDPDRGIGPALAAVNGPSVVAHPPMIYPSNRRQSNYTPAHFVSPFRQSTATAQANFAIVGSTQLAGAATGASYPIGEVSS